ncbi:MAG: hypothetical protein KatS3mg078_1985 [Deltaproteobacteria bacterium]|nr:MAG: hypothetical protein KatS3mg078_1985 [Deltaproteobacteria bacterium]
MKKLVAAFACILVFVPTNKAISSESVKHIKIHLSDIGYKTPLVLEGRRASYSFFFPLDGKEVVPDESFLEINTESSPVLSKDSIIKVSINDVPVFSSYITSSPNTLRIPLPSLDRRNDFVKVTVSVLQYITKDPCYDISTESLWTNILPSSFIKLALKKESNLSISRFIPSLKEEGKVVIGIPELRSLSEAKGAIWIYSFLKGELGEEGIVRIEEFGDLENWMSALSEKHAVVITKRPNNKETHPSIRLIQRNGSHILLLEGENEKQVEESVAGFLREDIRETALGDFLLIKSLDESYLSGKNKISKVSLSKLGLSDFEMEGIDRKQANVYLNLGLYPSKPKELRLILYGAHTPLDTARALLNIYLNKHLIKSIPLKDGSINGLVITLPSYLIRKENSVGLEISYSPPYCKADSLEEFKCEIYGTSYLEAVGTKRVETTFEDIPWLLNPHFVIFFKNPPSKKDIEVAGKLLYLIWQSQGENRVYPEVVTGELPPSIHNVVAVLSPSELKQLGLSPPLLPSTEGFIRIYDHGKKKVIWKVENTIPFGILEVFREAGRGILLATYTGDGGEELVNFLKYLSEGKRFSSLYGNIAIGDGKRIFFNFRGEEVNIEYPEQERLSLFWERYRFLIFAIAWLVLSIFCIFLYFRFRRE